MKKIVMVLGVAVLAATVSGCTVGRPLNSQDRAAILGASMGAALSNAHDAAFGKDDRKHQDDYRYNQSRHHHKNHEDTQDNGVVYQNGMPGYYDSYGEFHYY